jgi:hypothetical protein
MLNFYPFVQKYLQPSQKDVTKLLSIATQACHELVPPDAVDPLLRQLVNQFVHDKARPEAVAVGLQTVRDYVGCPFSLEPYERTVCGSQRRWYHASAPCRRRRSPVLPLIRCRRISERNTQPANAGT